MRGKHSGATMKRRAVESEDRVRVLERALKKERHEHAVTQRVADRVHAMEAACRRLEMEHRLATNGEVERLNSMVAALQAELTKRKQELRKSREKLGRLAARVVAEGGGSNTADGWEALADAVSDASDPNDELAGAWLSHGVHEGQSAEATLRIQRARGIRRRGPLPKVLSESEWSDRDPGVVK